MKHIRCKSYTSIDCNFTIEGSDAMKMKQKIRSHLESAHASKAMGKNYLDLSKINQIMQRIDNELMGREKQVPHRLV